MASEKKILFLENRENTWEFMQRNIKHAFTAQLSFFYIDKG